MAVVPSAISADPKPATFQRTLRFGEQASCLCAVLVLAIATVPGVGHAELLTGNVVSVADGDTVTVLDAQMRQHKVRLSGVDAPEKGQAFGQRSKESLSSLTYGKEVDVIWMKRDRYGRIIGKLMIQPPDCPPCAKTLDAGLNQVILGMAWWYRKYATEQSREDREKYELTESEARAKLVGLWRDPDPVPPWAWRKAKRLG